MSAPSTLPPSDTAGSSRSGSSHLSLWRVVLQSLKGEHHDYTAGRLNRSILLLRLSEKWCFGGLVLEGGNLDFVVFSMPRFKPCSYEQKVFIPLSLDEQLLEGSLEYAIHHLIEERVEERWFSHLYHNEQTGCRAYSPKLLLKVILFGYSRGLKSSRQLEAACKENVLFLALACQERPDHSTFSDFITRLEELMVVLYSEILLVCFDEGLLGGTEFSLDGLKLPSNASREWSGTLKDLRLKQEKLKERIKEKLREHRRADKEDAAATLQQGGDQNEGSEQKQRSRKRTAASIGRLRQKLERIGSFLEEAEPRQGASGEIQSNVTDNESARMRTGHGTIQGYNAQALVDAKHQIILHAQASSDGQDYRQVAPVFEGARETIQLAGLEQDITFEGSLFCADTSYHSEENLRTCEAHGLDAFIPDTGFRQRDARFSSRERHKEKVRTKKGHFTLEDFTYELESDCFLCPAGKVLSLEAATAINPRGTAYRRYRAEAADCMACPLRKQCLSGGKKTTRRSLHLSKDPAPQTLSQKMRAKIDLPESRGIYTRRLATVEPVFANIRYNKHLDRFTYRGRAKVNIQWMLFCPVHNLEKLAHLGRKYGKKKLKKAKSALCCLLCSLWGLIRSSYSRLPAPASAFPTFSLLPAVF